MQGRLHSHLHAYRYALSSCFFGVNPARLNTFMHIGAYSFTNVFCTSLQAFTSAGTRIIELKLNTGAPQPESCRIKANEIMYEVGYSDTKAFRTSIKKITGLSPVEYKNRYNKQAVAV